jgi:hypothetical protein
MPHFKARHAIHVCVGRIGRQCTRYAYFSWDYTRIFLETIDNISIKFPKPPEGYDLK